MKVLGKGNKERIIPVHSQLRNSIQTFIVEKKKWIEIQEGNFLVVNEKGKKMSPGEVYLLVNKYLNLGLKLNLAIS